MVVRKGVENRTETARDAVRRTEVDIDDGRTDASGVAVDKMRKNDAAKPR